jgi:hypothetical protein
VIRRRRANLEYVFETAPGSALINDIILDTTHAVFSLRDVRDRFDVLHVHSAVLLARGGRGDRRADGPHAARVVHARDDPLYSYVADRAWFVAISEAQRRFDEDLRYAGVVYNGIAMERTRCASRKTTSSCSSDGGPREGVAPGDRRRDRGGTSASCSGPRVFFQDRAPHRAPRSVRQKKKKKKYRKTTSEPVIPDDFDGPRRDHGSRRRSTCLRRARGRPVPHRLGRARSGS